MSKRKSLPIKSPTPKPPYMYPHRNLAIEAMIAAVIMNDQTHTSPVIERLNGSDWIDPYLASLLEANIVVICHEVEHALQWAPRTEIHRAVQRMVRQGRIIPKQHPTRAIPLYALAGCDDATHDASPSPA
jgi:hypothetical protein